MIHDATQRLVFKIVSSPEWASAVSRGRYDGSADDARDGYIHLSAAHQLAGTAAKYFRGGKDLLVVAFDAEALAPALKWEPSRGGELFPHYYGALPTGQSLWTRPLALDADGVPDVTDAIPC